VEGSDTVAGHSRHPPVPNQAQGGTSGPEGVRRLAAAAQHAARARVGGQLLSSCPCAHAASAMASTLLSSTGPMAGPLATGSLSSRRAVSGTRLVHGSSRRPASAREAVAPLAAASGACHLPGVVGLHAARHRTGSAAPAAGVSLLLGQRVRPDPPRLLAAAWCNRRACMPGAKRAHLAMSTCSRAADERGRPPRVLCWRRSALLTAPTLRPPAPQTSRCWCAPHGVREWNVRRRG
jgi:hypothetical protein